ncbi:uncharacterized protein LOC110036680 [Phalaenopsis equestris]|uniref:uncharacterized protein LOC110036680 n=1 Tax=Phalaenopsis equestris TaxID=78828 RepID=UPI0009E408E0|nr:uncharacterized protein LOC110036680 [Phalaenopsis equestris]XP_020596837.1 uncharacterized protein LOC110036680 [Phalaenopsis equestris]XP_020596838.1 uncharacterized protein LOC110036680 [Phalaenopsis equestris]XP_020596839.1 uncharacterized protein LOC110036680 [Phalaenopsis equestris]
MSGTSRRSHEDGGHSTPIKRSHEESSIFSGLSGKTIQPLANDFHLPYEPGLDGRPVKVQRIEPRDSDKRPLHRMSSSPNHGVDHPTTSENRSELRASKEARDVRTVIREIKSDTRDSCIDIKIDLHVNKADSDARDTRGDEKELRSDRGSYNDFKGVVKFERDNYAPSMSHTSWKESKDYLWPKRYTEPSNESMESWRIARHLQNTIEVGKDQLARAEDRNPLGSYEGVAENKVDLKTEDKLRDKDKKRKDDRQKDFGEWDKDRIDRRGSTQLGEINNEGKELKEDRELERWERERKDVPKDKEHNDLEKDHVKRESPNSNERENSHYLKEGHEASIKISDQVISTFDPRRPKDDGWKGSDRDLRDKKRERDADVGDRYVQSGKCYDKDLDDGAEGDGVFERDRDAFGYGIQQRRRMLRSRGTTQPTHREPRFRSRAREHDGSQGKPDASTVVYKAGECMQEILRTWREFEASQDGKTAEASQNYPTLEIRIPVEYVTSTNRQVRGAQLWGTDVYTNDSDLVAVLMHTGYCCPTSAPPPFAIHELRTTIRVLPPQECYSSTLRNNVRSRSWGAGIGCSFHIVRCCIIKKGGGTIDLEPRRTHVSAVEPTIAPVSAERTMTTRAAASNALRQQRFVREVTIQYNLCNEPWLKYSINIVADKGLKKPLYTSARLKKGEVLYLETHYKRYELCFNGEKSVCNGTNSTSNHLIESEQEKQQSHNVQNGDKHLFERENVIDVYRWSRCKRPLPQDFMHSIGIPLPVEHLEVLEENLDWEDVQWSQTGVWVAGKEYLLARVHFLSPN